jgi:hypothetical protein
LFAGANEVAGAFEVVVGKAGNVRLDHDVGGPALDVAHLILCDGEGFVRPSRQRIELTLLSARLPVFRFID